MESKYGKLMWTDLTIQDFKNAERSEASASSSGFGELFQDGFCRYKIERIAHSVFHRRPTPIILRFYIKFHVETLMQ